MSNLSDRVERLVIIVAMDDASIADGGLTEDILCMEKELEYARYEKQHLYECYQDAIRQLVDINALLKPSDLQLDNGTVLEFNPKDPQLVMDAWTALSKAIRAIA